MKRLAIVLVSCLFINVVFAESLATLPENLTINPTKNYRATVESSSNNDVLSHLTLIHTNGQVNYVYTDSNNQQKITFTIEQHFGETDGFLFQIFDENQTLIGKLALSNTSNIYFKGFALYSPDEDISRILKGQANPLIMEPVQMFSNTFKVYNKEKRILATLSGRAGRVEVKLNKNHLANEAFFINNPENLDLLLAVFEMQSLESILS